MPAVRRQRRADLERLRRSVQFIADVEVAGLRNTNGDANGKRHWRWRRKHLFGAARVVRGRRPRPQPAPANEAAHPVFHVWSMFGPHVRPPVAAGRPVRWQAQCRRCGAGARGTDDWRRLLATRCSAAAAGAVREDGPHFAAVADVGAGVPDAASPAMRGRCPMIAPVLGKWR